MSLMSEALKRRHDYSGVFPSGRIREKAMEVAETMRQQPPPDSSAVVAEMIGGMDTTPNHDAGLPTTVETIAENNAPHLVDDGGEEGGVPQTVHDAPTRPNNVSAPPPRPMIRVAISVPINTAMVIWAVGYIGGALITWMIAA